MALNLEKQLLFYGSYHNDPVCFGRSSWRVQSANLVLKVNVGIHMICVPAILITFFALFTNLPDAPLPLWLSIPYFPLNPGTVLALIYSILYILMEPVAGGLLAPLILVATGYANHAVKLHGSTANYWAAGINVFSWIAQFIGHGVYEGRAPALLDNLVQAIFLAPFFVWLELLFALGYRPELKGRMDQSVSREITKFKASKKSQARNRTNGSAH